MIHIDILTPKQVRFFSRLLKSLGKDEVAVTSREYRETIELLKIEEIDYTLVGEYGGRSLERKLEASLKRTLQLKRLISEIKPEVMVSHSSPEAARVAFGLGIPHLCVNDSPHAEAVARLTIPLSDRLLTPKIIPNKAWTKYGIEGRAIIKYNALDPAAWLHDLKVDDSVLESLDLSREKEIVVFRTEETYASYLLGYKPSYSSSIIPIVKRLYPILRDEIDMVVIPRYAAQISEAKRSLPEEVKVAEQVIDTPSLLSFASVFVGGGGTMTAEAALLGVPTISSYPGEPTLVDSFLIEKGLVKRINEPLRIAEEVKKTLKNLDASSSYHKEKAHSLLRGMEDPIPVIQRTIEKERQS